jgi:membrane protein implicated in regulation of membrane protease activity
MTVWQRYLLLQVPGWILAAVFAAVLMEYFSLPGWAAGGLLALIILKDFLLYPFLRRAYEDAEPAGAGALVGSVGTARQTLAPEGYVEVRGELWLAHAHPEDGPIAEGSRVVVVAADGVRLEVRRADASSGSAERQASGRRPLRMR